MSDPIDDKALDEYLKGGSVVSRHYRDLDSSEVPPELDRRVLAQAREAVAKSSAAQSRDKSRSWVRWGAPLAVAASVVLVLSIVIETGLKEEIILPQIQTRAVEAPAQEAVPAVAPAPAEESAAESAAVESKLETEQPKVLNKEIARAEPPAAPAPRMEQAPATPSEQQPATVTAQKRADSSAEAAADAVADERAASASRQRSVAPASAALQAPPPPSTAISQTTSARPADEGRASADDAAARRQTSAMRDEQSAPTQATSAAPAAGTVAETDSDLKAYTDPKRWLEDIRRLRTEGKAAQADREWQRFRQSFPNYTVSETDAARPPDNAEMPPP